MLYFIVSVYKCAVRRLASYSKIWISNLQKESL